MALDAGSVFATLGGDFSPKGFIAFDSAMKRSAAATSAFERHHSSSMSRIAKTAAFAGKAVAVGLGVGLIAAAGAISASVVQAVKFDAAMRNVNSIAQLSEKRFKTLKTSVLALAASSKQGPEILAKAMYDLVSSGFNATQSLTILKASAKGASAGMTDAATSTAAVAAVLNAYKLPASEAMHVTDQLFQTVNRGVLTFEQLANTIGDALPFAASLGVGLDQVGAAVSTMTKNGINAAETMTRLRRLFVSLLKPNKDMAATIHDLGFKSGEAMIKQKGLQGALEALVGTTNGSKAAVAKLFPDIRALGGALILTGKNARGAEKDLAAFKDVTGATNRALAEQKKSTQYQWQAFIAGVQAAAVVIGTGLLPMINKLIGRANSWLQGLQKDGSIDRWAKSISHAFQAAGDAIAHFGPQVLRVVSEVGSELLTMAGYARDVAAALISVGGALHLGDATSIKAIVAAIAGFKIASLVLPSVVSLGGALATLVLNARTAPSLAAFFSSAGLMANPMFLAAAGVAALAAGLVILSSRESDESKRAKESADAHQQQADAISAAHDASLATVGSQFAVTRAIMEQGKAYDALKKAREGGKPKEIAAAQLAYDEASLRVLSEQEARTKNLTNLQTERAKVAQQGARAAIAAAGQLAAAQSRLNYLQALKDAGPGAGKQFASAGGLAAYRQAASDVARYRSELAKVNSDNLRAANADILDTVNRLRLLGHVKPIGPEHAAAIGRLQNAIKTLPKSVQTRILLQDQAALLKMANVAVALDKIGQIQAIPRILADDKQLHGKLIDAAAKLAKLGQTTETATVLASTDTAQSKFQTLLNMLAAMHDKNITVTTRTQAIGLHKKAAGGKTQGAQLAVIGEGAAPEYVIPTEPRYRARGIDLLMSAAADLGVSMFRKGHGPRARTGARTGALDPTVLQDAVNADQTKLNDAIRSRDDAKQALKDAVGRDKKDKNRQKAIDAARDALKGKGKHPASTPREIKALRAKLLQAQADLKALTAYEASISQTGTQADTAITQMDDADETSNPDLFNASKKTALAQLDKELASTRKAIKGAKKGSPRMIELQSRLAQLQLQRDQIDHRKYAPGAVEGPAAFNLDELLAGAPGDPVTALALAGLTETPADDLAALAAEKAFLEQQLSGEQSGAKRRDWIIGLAEAISGINSQMAGLSGGAAGGGPTADQQALLDQANARADAAQRAADINAKYIGILGGSGDLGLAGVNSTTSKPAGPNQITINTLHPGDPQTLAAIASASVRGIDQQGGRPAKGLRI